MAPGPASCMPPTSTPSHAQDTSKNTLVQTPAKSETLVASTGHTRDLTCHRCHGIGYIARNCPNQCALFINDDGEYTSASDCDDEYVLAATDHAGGQDNDDIEEVHLHAELIDQYPILIVKLVLSAKERCEDQNQRHNLFQSKFLVKGHTVKVIIDSGSCNNLASEEIVNKFGLTTHPHPHPYHIQWFSTCDKMKEYDDVFHDEVPPRMVPVRDIEHDREDGNESWTNPIQAGEDDEDITSSDTHITTQVPMTSPSPVRPSEIALTSNGPCAFMPIPIWVILDLMESLSCHLSKHLVSCQNSSPVNRNCQNKTMLLLKLNL